MAQLNRVLSPKQLAQQWMTLPNKFEVNVLNFEATIGREARTVFRQSFYLGRFNTSGATAWQQRRDKRSHPILVETGSLRQSIMWKRLRKVGTTHGVKIYTNKDSFRTSKRQNNRDFVYAAIHNDPSGTHMYGNTGVPSIQRQFMGHSTILDDKLISFSKILFDGFPQ